VGSDARLAVCCGLTAHPHARYFGVLEKDEGYEMLQILSLTVFERIPLDQLLTKMHTDHNIEILLNQLNLFD
jgi:hypothetical protein